MMQKLRAAGQSWVAKALFFLLVASFAVWGIGPIFTGGRVQTAATAGKVDITTTQVDEAVQLQMQLMQRQYGVTMTAEQAAAYGLRREVAQQIVMQALYDQEAAKLGLRYGRETVMQTISSQPALRDESGRFDKARFQGMLQALRMSEMQYVNTMRGELTRTVLGGALQGAASAPALLATPLYQWQHEQRIAEVKTIKPADVKDVPAPTAEELAAFHKANSNKYTAPERRDFSVLGISASDLAKGISLTEDELKQAFNANPDEFGSPEKRTVAQTTTDDEAKATAVVAAIAKGKTLKEATLAEGLGYAEIADMTKGSTFESISNAIFALSEKQISPVVKSPMGYHVFELVKVTPAHTPDFEAVRSKVAEDLRAAKAADHIMDVSKQAQDQLAGGATVAEVAGKLGLKATSYTAIDRQGETAGGKKSEALDSRTLELAFSTNAGENSPADEREDGVTFIAVTKIDPERLRPLDEVRADVTTAWTASKKAELAEQQARTLAEQLNSSDAQTASLSKTGELQRGQADKAKLPADVLAAIFNAKLNTASVVRSGTDSWVIRPVSMTRPTPSGEQLKETQETLKGLLGVDLMDQFSAALRADYGTSLNEAWLGQAVVQQ